MAFKLNKIQQKAVDSIEENISLKAGAGTGKTKVLTERYINILENGNLTSGNELDEILAITFTNKAAQEMRGRILKAIRSRVAEEKFRNLYKYFSKANIYTIHGFCGKVIRDNPLIAGVDPNFQIADDIEADFLLEEAVEDVLNEEFRNELFIEFLFKRKEMNINKLLRDIKALYKEIRNNSYRLKDLKDFHRIFTDNIRSEGQNFENLFVLLDEYAKIVTSGKFKKLRESMEYLDFLENPDIDFLDIIQKNLGTSKKDGAAEIRDKINDEIIELSVLKEISNEKYYELIFEIIDKIDRKYIEKKENRAILDYQDLQFLAFEVINKTDCCNYKYIMIDEFQDTDGLQAEIFSKISEIGGGKAKIFVVGDPKQSIYGFRGSNIEEYNKFTEKIKNSGRELIMDENYRSSGMLINSFNEIFGSLMDEKYDALEAKGPYAKKYNYKIETLDFEMEEDIEDDGGSEIDKKSIEAKMIAKRIKKLLDEGERASEIAVLYRAKANINLLEDELLKLNIPVNNTAEEFKEKREIKDMITMLKAISNKSDFLSFIAYLRSPMAGLNDNSLVLTARFFDRDRFEFDYKYLKYFEKNERFLFKRAYEKIEKLRKMKKVLNLSELVKNAIYESRYFEIAPLLYGVSAKDNLYKLIDVAIKFESEVSSNFTEFFKYINEADIEISEDTNAVNLLTIHKSKGLEFDNVIIAETDKKFNTGMRNNFFGISKEGLGFNFEDTHSKYDSIKKRNKTMQEEEELRMFYVAATRAKKRLILSAVNIDFGVVMKCDSYIGFFKNSKFNDYEELSINIDDGSFKEKVVIPKSFIGIAGEKDDRSLVRKSYIDRIKEVKYYTVSAFMTFKDNKESYYNRYILGIDEKYGDENYDYDDFSNYDTKKVLEPVVKGNIVHSYAEENPSDEDAFIEKSLRRYGILPNSLIIAELKRQFLNYRKRLSGEVLYRELEFYYKVKNGVIHGFIDQIRDDGGLEIIDFKTGRINADEAVKYYSPQLQIYSRAFEDITGKRVDVAKLQMLSDNTEIKIDISDEAVNKAVEEFEEFIDFVESHRDIDDYRN